MTKSLQGYRGDEASHSHEASMRTAEVLSTECTLTPLGSTAVGRVRLRDIRRVLEEMLAARLWEKVQRRASCNQLSVQ